MWGKTYEKNTFYRNYNGNNELPTIEAITGDISYDTETKIVYWDTYGNMTPYLSKDGRYCRYEKGKIVPIERKE